jgi:hypothetical protein
MELMSEMNTVARSTESAQNGHEVWIRISSRRAAREWGGAPFPIRTVRAPYSVDLSKLSPLARRIAGMVDTTEMDDDASRLVLKDRRTHRELLQMSGRAEEISRIEGMYGLEYLSERGEFGYEWPRMEDDESVEEYFERCAAEIEWMNCDVVRGWRQ